MEIKKQELDRFAKLFNEANGKDEEPMQNKAKDGAAIVLGALNGYLHLFRKADKNKEFGYEYGLLANAFQDITDWFVTGLDIQEWKYVESRGKGRVKIEIEPKDEEND